MSCLIGKSNYDLKYNLNSTKQTMKISDGHNSIHNGGTFDNGTLKIKNSLLKDPSQKITIRLKSDRSKESSIAKESVFLDYDQQKVTELEMSRNSIESIYRRVPQPDKISQLRKYISNDEQYKMVWNAKKKKHLDAS